MSTFPFIPHAGGPPRRPPPPLGPLDLKRLISTAEVARLAGVSASSIRRWREEDASFPAPLLLGDRTLRWPLGEVLAWLESRPRADGSAWADESDLAEREVAILRARDEAASRALDRPRVPQTDRRR